MRVRRLLLTASMLLSASLGYADGPRHVRIVWDVASVSPAVACYLEGNVTDPEFKLPESPKLGTCPQGWRRVEPGTVKKGDYVTVYAYNYNAVSYKALAPTATALEPEEPVAITFLLGVLKAASLGVKALDVKATGAGPVWQATEREEPKACLPKKAPPPPQEEKPEEKKAREEAFPRGCIEQIGDAIKDIEIAVKTWNTDFRETARLIAGSRSKIPTNLMSLEHHPTKDDVRIDGVKDLDAFAAKFFCDPNGTDPLGSKCPTSLNAWAQSVGLALGEAARSIRAFDTHYNPQKTSDEFVSQRDRYKRALDGWVDYLTGNQSGVRSELAAGVIQLAEDLAAIKSYRDALDPQRAASYAVQLPPQGPAGRLNTLVFTLPLQERGTPEGAPAQVSRTYTIEVAPDHPRVMASAGVIWVPSGLDFKELAIQQVPSTGSGGTLTLSKRLVAVDTDEKDVTALLATHFRLHDDGRVPSFVLGTTADEDIFRRVLLGGSWFVPRWRSVFNVGAFGAKGSRERDLQPVIDEYTVNGTPPDSINLAQVPVPEKWYWRLAVAWTLTPF